MFTEALLPLEANPRRLIKLGKNSLAAFNSPSRPRKTHHSVPSLTDRRSERAVVAKVARQNRGTGPTLNLRERTDRAAGLPGPCHGRCRDGKDVCKLQDQDHQDRQDLPPHHRKFCAEPVVGPRFPNRQVLAVHNGWYAAATRRPSQEG